MTEEKAGKARRDPIEKASGNLEKALETIAAIDIVSENGIIVCESAQETVLPELPAPYAVGREYRYGKIKVSIYHRAVEEEA